jgi:hypothetical protein
MEIIQVIEKSTGNVISIKADRFCSEFHMLQDQILKSDEQTEPVVEEVKPKKKFGRPKGFKKQPDGTYGFGSGDVVQKPE